MLLSEEGVVLDALDAKGRTAAAVARDRGHNQVGPLNDPFFEFKDSNFTYSFEGLLAPVLTFFLSISSNEWG
jgi:hypothetical protein